MSGPFERIREVRKVDRFDTIVEYPQGARHIRKAAEPPTAVQKFNPYHDRLGRFASAPGGGVSLGMGVDGAAAGGKRAAVAGTLKDVEKANKDLDYEVGTVINPSNGKVIFSKKGGAMGVTFNSSEAREIAGKIVTHNHPDDLIFSPTDVATSYHVSAIRATNPNGTVYELSGMNRKEAILAYRDHYMAARSESFQKLGIAEGTRDSQLQGSQRTGSFSYISDSCHKWLTDNAGKYGYQYSKGRMEE